MSKIKILFLMSVLILVGTVLCFPNEFSTSAKSDVLREIAQYKTWSRITGKPFKVESYASSQIAVWSFIVKSTSLVHNPTAFPMPVKDGNMTRIIMPGSSIYLKNPPLKSEEAEKRLDNPHENSLTASFGMVYANDLAKAEFDKQTPIFPIGSVIVREKNAAIDSAFPDVVIAMVKREKGFSQKTDDWEFFTFDGTDLKMRKRETKGDCAKCHAQVEKNDWVFRIYPR